MGDNVCFVRCRSRVQREVFPQRGDVQGLDHLFRFQYLAHLFGSEDVHMDVFGRFLMLFAHFLDAGCQERVAPVGVVGRIGRCSHEELPLAAAESGFFTQFSFCCFQWGFAWVYHSCHQFEVCLSEGVAVLVLHHEVPLLGYGYHVDPVRELQYEPFGYDIARWQLDPFLS